MPGTGGRDDFDVLWANPVSRRALLRAAGVTAAVAAGGSITTTIAGAFADLDPTSHDIRSVLAVADRVVVLRLGAVVHDGPVSEITHARLLHLMAGLEHPDDAAMAAGGGPNS